MILDVDGTLVDSNDAHARAWAQAFAERGITVAYEPVRRVYRDAADVLAHYNQSVFARSHVKA